MSTNQNIGKAKEKITDVARKAKTFLTNGEWYTQILLAVLIFIVFCIVTNLILNVAEYFRSIHKGSPWLYKDGDTKDATKAVQVDKNILRSTNQIDGIEFTYVFWMYVKDWKPNENRWKHVLHKGNDNSWPNRAPGIWLHPTDNKMRVYMNTFNSVAGSYIDVDNIPLNKWLHVAVMVTGRYLDVYINGSLKKRLVLDGIPRQNHGDVYINRFGGFDGYMSCIRYFDYSISPIELEYIVKKGPKRPKLDVNEEPPYLATNWWINNYSASSQPGGM